MVGNDKLGEMVSTQWEAESRGDEGSAIEGNVGGGGLSGLGRSGRQIKEGMRQKGQK